MMGEACYFRQRPGWPLEGVTFEQRADWSKEASNTQVKEQRFWCIWKQARPVQYPPYTWKEGPSLGLCFREPITNSHTCKWQAHRCLHHTEACNGSGDSTIYYFKQLPSWLSIQISNNWFSISITLCPQNRRQLCLTAKVWGLLSWDALTSECIEGLEHGNTDFKK